MVKYTITKGTIPIAQIKRRSVWKTVSSWALAVGFALAILGLGLQRIS
jgi:hypothetical protein